MTKAIILAAGEGSRLRPHTLDKPKCLVTVGEETLLARQIRLLRQCGVQDIVVIRGYKADAIQYEGVRYYENPEYDSTNMVETLMCARQELEGDVIVSYGDIYVQEVVIQALLESQSTISVIVDLDWREYWEARSDDPLSDAETLRIDGQGNLLEIGQKPSSLDEIEAQYIGLMRFRGKGLEALLNSYAQAKKAEAQDKKAWRQDRPLRKAYMTDLLQGLIYEGHALRAVPVYGNWLEIDSVTDYEMILKGSDVTKKRMEMISI